MSERETGSSPAEAFARMIDTPVKYLDLSYTSQVLDDDAVECARTLVWRVSSRCFTSTNGTFGGVALDDSAADNVSLMLWLMEMCRRTKVNFMLVSLYNEESATLNTAADMVGYLLVIPLTFEDFIPFAQNAQAALTGVAVDGGEDASSEAAEAAPRAAGRPKKKRKRVNPKSTASRVSWQRIDNEAKLLEIVRRQSIGADEEEVYRLDWDSVVSDAAGHGEDTAEGMSFLRLFDADEHFGRPHEREWYARRGVPLVQRSGTTYFDGSTCFADVEGTMYAHAPWALREVRSTSHCLAPDSNTLLGYMLPNNDPPLSLLRHKISANSRYLGMDVDERIDELDDDETIDLFRYPDGAFRNYGRSVVVSGPHPFKDQPATLFSAQWKSRLYPVMYQTELKNIARKKAVARLHASGGCDDAAVRRAHLRVADDVTGTLTEHALGVVPYYASVHEARLRLGRVLRSKNGDVAEHARSIYYYRRVERAGAMDTRPFDRELESLADAITLHMGVTAQQLRIVMTVLMTICASAEHEFGDQFAIALFGESDVGKSFAMQIVCCLLDHAMQQQQNDASDKAWVLDGVMPFLFTWLDEVNIGLSDSSKARSKDSKTMQAGLSTGVMSYKQYVRGVDGEDDYLLVRHVDCRKNWAMTSNVMVNKAMESRLDVRHQWDGDNDPGTKGKLNAAACASNGVATKGCSLAIKYIMTGSAYMWNARANGAYTAPLDFRMMEVFIGLYTTILLPVGFPKLKCRDINRHKHVAKGIFNFTLMNSLYRDEALAAVAASKERELAFYVVRGGVVPMRAVEVAFNLNAPCRKFAALETRALCGIATMITFTNRDAPVMDGGKAYYATSVAKRDAAAKVAQNTRLAGHNTADDIIASALTKLECEKLNGMPKVIYNPVNYVDTLFVLKDAVHHVDVQTDHMAGIYEWLQKLSHNEALNDLYWVCVDVHEEHYLFSRRLVDVVRGEASTQTITEVGESADIVGQVGTDVSRRRALHAILCAEMEDPGCDRMVPVATEQTGADTEYPYYGMLFMNDPGAPGYASAKQCKDGGEFSGRCYQPHCMSGALRVNKSFLDGYKRGEQQAKGQETALESFRGILAAVSGESMPGEMCFRNSSGTIDANNGSSERTATRAMEGSWSYPNPRGMAKTDRLDHSQYFEKDTVHPEDKQVITVSAGDNLYQRMCEERARDNCYGKTITQWEDMYGLPHMFD